MILVALAALVSTVGAYFAANESALLLAAAAASLVLVIVIAMSASRERHGASSYLESAHSLADNAPIEMVLKGADGRYLYANKAFQSLVGKSLADIRGRTPEEVYPAEEAAMIREFDQEVLQTKKTIFREITMKRANGSRFMSLTKFPFFDEDGTFAGIGTVVTDLTDMREKFVRLSEQDVKIRTILDRAPIGVFLKDADGRYAMANTAFVTSTEMTQDDVVGRTIPEAFQGQERPEWSETDRAVRETREPVIFETVVRADGREPQIKEVMKFPIIDDDGNMIGIGGIEVDMTERKRIERELLIAKEDAELANRAKTDFLANMSHEIRTPLNAILGFSQVLQSEVFGPIGSERYRAYAADIYNSGTHLMELIGDILDLSKIEAGRMELVEESVDLREAADASANLLRDQALSKGVALNVSLPAEARVVADGKAVRQILINLISNAVKFTRAGGSVEVGAETLPDGGLRVFVADTGIGIATDDLEKVLEPFTQLRKPNVQGEPGSGIGLAIVDRLCRAMEMELSLASSIGEGTTVSVAIPAKRAIRTGR